MKTEKELIEAYTRVKALALSGKKDVGSFSGEEQAGLILMNTPTIDAAISLCEETRSLIGSRNYKRSPFKEAERLIRALKAHET